MQHFNQQLPFPVQVLPEIFHNAVIEVFRNTQAPIAMIAASALGAISLSSQHALDVRRPNGLVSPVSLFFMIIAESGERKTTVDRLFTKAIQQFEAQHLAEKKAKETEFEAKFSIWKRGLDQIHSNVDKALKSGNSALLQELKNKLCEHQKLEPERSKSVKLMYNNATSEALLHGLSQCPSAAIFSNEGGNVLNGRVMADLPMLNSAWDGSIQTVDRKTSESFIIPNVRLTTSIMLQRVAFEKFLNAKGEEARGVGFFARQLLCYPESTQGYRFIGEETPTWDALNIFQDRMSEILKTFPIDGEIKSTILEFSPEAKSIWTRNFNEIEGMMQEGYWLCDVRDFASKVGENMARIAALLHYFEGTEGNITANEMNSAREIMRWYVYEFKRFFGSAPSVPQVYSDALLLENWLICQLHIYNNYFPKNRILQFGPNRLRNRAQLNAALEYLHCNNRIFLQRNGKRFFVSLNHNAVLPQYQHQQPMPSNYPLVGNLI